MPRGTLSPTVMKRPFLNVNARATVLRPSIVWMLPLTSASRLIRLGRRLASRLGGHFLDRWTDADSGAKRRRGCCAEELPARNV